MIDDVINKQIKVETNDSNDNTTTQEHFRKVTQETITIGMDSRVSISTLSRLHFLPPLNIISIFV